MSSGAMVGAVAGRTTTDRGLPPPTLDRSRSPQLCEDDRGRRRSHFFNTFFWPKLGQAQTTSGHLPDDVRSYYGR